ncbi:regulator [Acidovorax sp. Root217]|uniref:RCC1 domain-containing protein n=1 Tax=Acidovorax sp. Root217 TaxID=1736492 RepID=UPI0009E8ECD8|nr:regulator [Acidovorax sp. Root217]
MHSTTSAPRLLQKMVLLTAALLLSAAFAPTVAMATTVSMGTSHGCSAADTHKITCWGSLAAPDFGPYSIKDVKVGRDFSCALLTNASVKCWGSNDLQQLGGPPVPETVARYYNADAIAVGATHACFRFVTRISCWGDGSQGQLGRHVQTQIGTETAVDGLSDVRHVAAGHGSTCVARLDGKVVCVGAGSGLAGAADDPRQPRTVPGISDALEVSLFDGHACVLRWGGRVSCWGNNRYGELGVPAGTGPLSTPVEVTGLAAAAKAVAVGNGYTCALLVNGTVSCWGNNANGQLGTGLAGGTAGQVTGITDATAISAGRTAACAVLEGGYVQCWGEGAGWNSAPCRMTTSFYPGVPATYNPPPDLAICLPQGSAAPMAVQGLGPVHDAALVLDWAEKTMPLTFAPQAAKVPAHIDGPYYLREYPGGHKLAVNGHGTPHLMYLGPESGGRLLDLGPLSQWVFQASRDAGIASGMQLQAGPYVDLMPGSGPCWEMIVPHAIRGGAQGLPDGLVTTAVRIESGGQSMEFPIRERHRFTVLTTATNWLSQQSLQPGQPVPPGMKEEPIYYGAAEGCPTIGTSGEVDVIVFYTLGQKKGLLRAKAKVGSAA